MFTVAIFPQLLKTGKSPVPIVVQLVALKLTVVRLLQLEKAGPPMLVTEAGMVTVVRLLQFEKAPLAMLVSELPKETDVKPIQL